MKKLIPVILTLLTATTEYALPLGNPSEASLLSDGAFFVGSWCDVFSLRLGYYGDFVFNRHLEIDDADENTSQGKEIEHASLYTNAGYIAANFWERFDVFATLGASHFNLYTNAIVFSGPLATGNGNRLTLECDPEFSWSLGLRITIWECAAARFGIEGQYFWTNPEINRISIRDETAEYPGSFANMKYQEWQIGVGVSYPIWTFVPYIGVKISGVKIDFGDAQFLIQGIDEVVLRNLKNHFETGYVIGLTLIDCDYAAVTIEARFPDEKAVYLNGQFRF